MASKNRDVRAQALTIGTDIIPIGGEGISVRLSHGTLGEVVRGVATSIKTQPGELDGVLTVSVYPEDAASPILRRIVAARRVAGAASVPLPGTFINTLNGETVTWNDSHVTEAGDVVGGTDTEIVTYTFALIGLTTTQVPT